VTLDVHNVGPVEAPCRTARRFEKSEPKCIMPNPQQWVGAASENIAGKVRPSNSAMQRTPDAISGYNELQALSLRGAAVASKRAPLILCTCAPRQAWRFLQGASPCRVRSSLGPQGSSSARVTEEPGAGKPHAGICAGGASASLPRLAGIGRPFQEWGAIVERAIQVFAAVSFLVIGSRIFFNRGPG
jgi:hypothetical protein